MFGNLLSIAATVIPQQHGQWLRWISRETDERGRWVDQYEEPRDISGSLQAVDGRTMKELGFDTTKTYKTLFTSNDVQGINDGEAADQLVFDGVVYDVVGDNSWYLQDGWKYVYCVQVRV